MVVLVVDFATEVLEDVLLVGAFTFKLSFECRPLACAIALGVFEHLNPFCQGLQVELQQLFVCISDPSSIPLDGILAEYGTNLAASHTQSVDGQAREQRQEASVASQVLRMSAAQRFLGLYWETN